MAAPIEETNRGRPDTSRLETGQPAAPGDLGQLWRCWLATVEEFARQRGRTRGQVDPREYRSLHRELIDTCRALARAPGNPKREVYEQMESLIAPWLSVVTLENADGEILADLLLRCRQIDRQIVGRRWGVAVRRGVRYLLPFLVVAGGGFLIVRTADWILFPFLNWANGWILQARWAMTRSDATIWLFGGGVLVILLACYLVSRVLRKY